DSGAAGGPSTCDGSLSPDVDGCVISDDYGVFVSPGGDDTTGDGTEAAPYATLTTALAKLDAIKRIYVCASEYAEPGTLEIPGGVSIYGGFGCDGGVWRYDPANNKTSFKPMSPIGAELNGAKGVTLQDLSIIAANATSPGGSSFGMTLVDSGAVLTRVKIRAGSGAIGTAGVDGVNGADGADPTPMQNGHAPVCVSPADNNGGLWAAPSDCSVRGGTGGTGYLSIAGDSGKTGVPLENIATPGAQNGGAGATTAGTLVPGTIGGTGSGGLSGATAASAKEIGSFSAAGYAVATGGDGTNGFAGQGGGGGGASRGNGTACTGASGAAGGMGGCGGTLATGGKGGGGSIAVLSWNSSLTLVNSSLVASSGGAGGKGGKAGTGGAGKSGGQGGGVDTQHGVGAGGGGGSGGPGGNGGNGAGGTGGPSIALVYSMTEPAMDALSTLVPGTGGAAGVGGTYGNVNTKAPDGTLGVAKDKYVVP
ncbi:MAG: hypothetical protein ABIQ16_10680, partial [Polyangiaceae bacterium]